ncbi:MAG: pyruvate:ferredoxin (flavodoxin) oxidoreductase, partial [Alphaproteobacteria bacterium]|nr:pyruvate:ferredoxin (flavodoxin) oxidoreductase [Alphaproteobacteria bacterium]
ACAGCGETQYVKLLSQLFGDRAIIANATGCSSIYGGNLPTTPYSVNAEGRGPAWSNSLFEDNAEFGLGMRIGIDKKKAFAEILLKELSAEIGEELVNGIIGAKHATEEEIASQRANVKTLKSKLSNIKGNKATMLKEIADFLVHKSVWLVGGDGWAYDIGFGGIDHAFGLNRNVNILVMDTEVYSNTGGQQSKATPMCASAKFAAAGRELQKKDLGMIAMSYETVYVAKIALGAKDAQTIKAFREAEAYEGTSLIIAYSHCISHGIDMSKGLQHQKMAVESGHWPLYRYDPRLLAEGKAPLQLDSGDPKTALSEFMNTESRFKIVEKQDPKRFKSLLEKAEHENAIRRDMYKHMAD